MQRLGIFAHLGKRGGRGVRVQPGSAEHVLVVIQHRVGRVEWHGIHGAIVGVIIANDGQNIGHIELFFVNISLHGRGIAAFNHERAAALVHLHDVRRVLPACGHGHAEIVQHIPVRALVDALDIYFILRLVEFIYDVGDDVRVHGMPECDVDGLAGLGRGGSCAAGSGRGLLAAAACEQAEHQNSGKNKGKDLFGFHGFLLFFHLF